MLRLTDGMPFNLPCNTNPSARWVLLPVAEEEVLLKRCLGLRETVGELQKDNRRPIRRSRHGSKVRRDFGNKVKPNGTKPSPNHLGGLSEFAGIQSSDAKQVTSL